MSSSQHRAGACSASLSFDKTVLDSELTGKLEQALIILVVI